MAVFLLLAWSILACVDYALKRKIERRMAIHASNALVRFAMEAFLELSICVALQVASIRRFLVLKSEDDSSQQSNPSTNFGDDWNIDYSWVLALIAIIAFTAYVACRLCF